MSILREIGIIARALDSIANIEFRDLDLARGQYLYLVRIAEQPGMIQEELSELLKVDRSTVARSVKRLEERGMIQQRPRGENLKTKEWELTEKGKQIYPFILGEHLYSETTALKGFSKEEVAQLEEYLIRVRENITIPKYETLTKDIQNALEEKEREEFTRLKVIKRMKQGA